MLVSLVPHQLSFLKKLNHTLIFNLTTTLILYFTLQNTSAQIENMF